MTDNRTTELLHCPFCGSGWLYETRRNGYCDETPTMFCNSCKADYHGYEQAAIEAWESIKAWNTRATHGTLTAEQVRKAIESRFDFDVWVPNARWQAIADELNAELRSGTCELVEVERYSNANEVVHVLKCSECGETCEHVNGSYPRCPHCGKAVKK